MFVYTLLAYTPFPFALPLSALILGLCAVGCGFLFRKTESKLSLSFCIVCTALCFLCLLLFGEAVYSVCVLLLLAVAVMPYGKGEGK